MTNVVDIKIPGQTSAEDPPTRYLCIAPAASAGEQGGLAHQRVQVCAAGQTIARVALSAEPPIPQARVVAVDSIRLGKNVAWNADRSAIVADRSGHVLLQNNVLIVEEKLELAVDLDVAMPIDFPGDVTLRGNMLDQARLRAAGNVTVNGAIEAADIALGGDLAVHHGICGKARGSVRAGGAVHARFVSNADVQAGGDIHVQNEIGNSRVMCKGQFVAPEASLLSSHITAGQGISCHSAGSTAGFKTILELGIDPKELAEAYKTVSQLADQRGKAQDIRSKVEPLLKNQRNLTPQQKEKATELLYLADEADACAQKVAAALNPLRARLDAALAAEIKVAGMLHANVVLRSMGYETLTTAAIKGPVRITLRLRAEGALFVIADANNRPMSTLPAIATDAARQLQSLKS